MAPIGSRTDPIAPVLLQELNQTRVAALWRGWTAALLHTHQFDMTSVTELDAFGEPVTVATRRCACGRVSHTVVPR